MKRILILSDEFYPKQSAISNVVYSTCQALLKYDDNITIDVLCNKYGANPEGKYKIQDRLYGMSQPAYWMQNQTLTQKFANAKGIKKFYYKIKLHFSNAKTKVGGGYDLQPTYRKALSLIKKCNYEYVIAMQYPLINVLVGLLLKEELKNKIKLATILSDPQADHINYKDSSEQIKNAVECERKIYQAYDKIITTPELFYNVKYSPIGEYKDKVTIIPSLPTLVDNTVKSKGGVSENQSKEYNFIFSGSLYEKMRAPKFCFDFFLQLPDNYILNLYAFQVSDEARKAIEKSNGRIRLLDQVSKDELNLKYRQSDFIVNIGNRTNTQVASKVLEYIGCGKPIINFYNLDDDTSRKYFNGYPMYFEVKESDNIDNKAIKDFICFCDKNYGKNLEFSETYKHISEVKTENIIKIIHQCLFE